MKLTMHHDKARSMPPHLYETTCPQPDILRRYVDGEGPSNDLDSIDAHISHCPHCQKQLEQLGHPSDFMSRLVSEAAQSPPVELGSALEKALERIRKNPVFVDGSSDRQVRESAELVQIRDYRILESIGEGGMGRVYRAVHTRLHRPVAIKVLRQDRVNSKEAIARFSREMQVIAQLEHPHIVRALDAGEQDGLHYLVMEFLAGVDVGQLSARLGPLPTPEACQIIKLAASALQFAHDRKILHRDVKPSNILLTVDGGVKILDLGLAQFSEFNCDPSLSRADQALGTLAYMAPEQLSRRDEVTARADVFSLGVSLHEILTGQRPFERLGAAPLLAELSASRPDVDAPLKQLIRQMVSNVATERPASMQEVIERLAPYTVSADLPSLVHEYFRWNRRKADNAVPNSVLQTNASHSIHDTREITMTTAKSAPMGALGSTGNATQRSAWGWAYGLAITALAVALLVAIVVNTPRPSPIPDPPPIITGDLEISPLGPVAEQLLKDGAVFLVKGETKESVSVRDGINAVAPGSYTIKFDAPEEIDALEDIQVAKGSARKVQLTTALSKPFQFPFIPKTVGSFAPYHGTLWHAGWPKGQELPFNIRMQNIGNEKGTDGSNHVWLKIEIKTHHTSGDFTETGFLLVNADRWNNENRMEIFEGYVRASGDAIAKLGRNSKQKFNTNQRKDRNDELVVRFDPDRDTLRDFASSAIPEQRLSLHDFIALFFGDDQMAAAAEPIRKLRAELPRMGDRNARIESVSNGQGDVPCYVVSSRKREDSQEKMGYFMARRKSEPFSFVRLEVNTPVMKALCVVTGSGVGSVDATEIARVKGLLSESPTPNANKNYWDRAGIPTESAITTWHGIIAFGAKPRQIIQTTVSALGAEVIDNVECRWLEIEVSSALEQGEDPHYEAARLLVDDEQYRTLGTLDIKKGWIAYGDKNTVFAFPTDKKLYDLVHQRLILSDDPKFNRFGVIDVLSMLFDADCYPQSPLSLIRAKVKGSRVGMNPKRTLIDIELGGAPPIPGELWTPPEQSQEIHYNIRKSTWIPFDLVDVVFELKSSAKLSLEIKNHAWLGDRGAPMILGSDGLLEVRQQETQSRVKQASKSNWRVWTWEHEGRTFKAFAEYGGTTDWDGVVSDRSKVVVLLRNRRGDEIRVPSSVLDDEDWKWARNGRTWVSMSPAHQDKQYLMVKDKNDMIGFQMRDTPDIYEKRLAELDPIDQEWIRALRQARKLKVDPANQTAEWMQFAPYIR